MNSVPRAVLVERLDGNSASTMEELKALAQTAGYEVVATFIQSRPSDPRYCIGLGKAREIAGFLAENPVDKVIFANSLKPVQLYNLAKLFDVEVIDRFQLILEIFWKHARTREAKYQIELAQLKYELPIIREKIRLAKLGELPGFHGLGRYEVDVYERAIKSRITQLQRLLLSTRRHRSLHRESRRRRGFMVVAITGYTNAGKTTLFNLLTGESKRVENSLFTTLSTAIRATPLTRLRIAVVDTVGFIDRLPHLLVEAFYSTLEEVALADLVLLVIDASNSLSEVKRKTLTSINTLREIGVSKASILPVINKVDLVDGLHLRCVRDVVEELLGERGVPISAATGEGLQSLVDAMVGKLAQAVVRIELPYTAAHFFDVLNEVSSKGMVIERMNGRDSLQLTVRVPAREYSSLLSKLTSLGAKVEAVKTPA